MKLICRSHHKSMGPPCQSHIQRLKLRFFFFFFFEIRLKLLDILRALTLGNANVKSKGYLEF